MRADLLPHSSLEFIHSMYQDAFSLIHNPRRIVIIAPIHNEVFESDAGECLFTLSSGDVLTPLGGVHIEQVPGVKINDEYAEREYAIEIFYPYIACNSPHSSLLPLFTSLDSKEDILTLSRLMAKLKKEENDTLFIVSGNFTSLGSSEEINSMAKTLKELLEEQCPSAGCRKQEKDIRVCIQDHGSSPHRISR